MIIKTTFEKHPNYVKGIGIIMPASRRHHLVIASGRKKTPFCHYIRGNRTSQKPTEMQSENWKLWSKGKYITPSDNMPYHATKGYRRIAQQRL